MPRSELSVLMEALNQRPISYHPTYRLMTGSFSAGVLISQIMYWHASVKRPFHKTDEEFAQELLMSVKEFRTAKKYLDGIPFIKTERKGARGRTTYSVDYDLFTVIMKRVAVCLSQMGESDSLTQTVQSEMDKFTPNGTISLPQTVQSLTETTTETTKTETTYRSPSAPKEKDSSDSKPSSQSEQNKHRKRPRAEPPSWDEVYSWALQWSEKNHKDYRAVISQAKEAFEYYESNMRDLSASTWKDKDGNTVKNWKLKIARVWLTDNKLKISGGSPVVLDDTGGGPNWIP